ncbi:MAG: T9SS-dependent M36 family metallopeptidase [Aequorivita sp.]
MKKVIYVFIFFAVNFSFGQDFKATVKSYLQQHKAEFSLQQQDISDISISSEAYSNSLKAYNVYVEQNYQGIKVFNSVSPFLIKNGQVVHADVSFADKLSARINSTSPSITATAAILKAATALGLGSPTNLSLLETSENNSYVYSNGGISLENIPVQLVLQRIDKSSSIRLAWDLSIYLLDASHYYSVRIDAITGEVLATDDWVVSCDLGDGPHSHSNTESILFADSFKSNMSFTSLATPSYRVFPMPLIGPNDGADQLILDPSDIVASPFGWHDTDGVVGPEFTTTRGNNVLAKEDHAGNNSNGNPAEGGANLLFDFPYNLPRDPLAFTDAAITNLFYWNNIMHDVFYHYGFDEVSGNFQLNNYGKGGKGGDFVVADGQDGGGLNNANFYTPPDGAPPRMQMYLWSAPGKVLGTFLTVNGGPLGGKYYGFDSNFAPPLTGTPITSDLVLVEDDNSGNSDDPYDGCDNILNAGAINGHIAILRRGECNFTEKILNVQNAGAIAVIVVNNVSGDPIIMGGTGAQITIPGLMIYKSDGEAIIAALINGDTVNATLRDDGSGNDPFRRDGDLDNVIITHEYGHGISNRLTGGPNNVGCLQNQEQMGEGWSDYFGLMLTMKPGDLGTDARGIGGYAIGQGIGGLGLRTKAYSTDFAINNFTYNSIKTQAVPHGVGSVWATMLWDLTWAFIDQYGFDPDIYHGTGGNNMALQLVVDGLKLQPCSPGFVTGRDAILQADLNANGGANECLIWNAFAKRGLGLSASQGSSNNRSDGTEAFDVPVGCQLGVGDKGELKNSFLIYPNPSNGDINIQSRYDVGEASISIFDMNGRKVFDQKVEMTNKANINASGLTTGIYLIKVDGGGYTQTSKLVIN